MIENIKNIGQILMPANQAATGKAETAGPRRFTVSENHDQPEKTISSDNKSQDVNNRNDRSDVLKDKPKVDKKSNNKAASKTESHKDKKCHITKDKKPEKSIPSEPQENEEVNPQPEVVVDDSTLQNELPEQNEIDKAIALYVSEQSNTVTGHAVKSQQIKELHETESGQLGIKTILPENSNGENGLKEVSAPVDNQQAKNVLSEVKTEQNTSEKPSDENLEQITPDTTVDKNNEAGQSEIANLLQTQKKALSENGIVEKPDDIDINDLKASQQVQQVAKSDKQTVTDSAKHTNEQQPDQEINVSPAAQQGDNLFDASSDNTKDSSKQKINIAEVLSADSKDNVDNVHAFDIKPVVEQTFANTQTGDDQKVLSMVSEKANPEILKDNAGIDISSQISKHITETIQSSTIQQGAEKQITIRLNPPELGSVMIKFTESGSELSGTLEVSKHQTKTEIEHALPDIIKSLSESGIQLKKIDVVSTENKFTNSDSAKEQLMQGDNSGQNNSGNQHAGTGGYNKSGFQQWFSSTIEYSRGYASQNQYAASGSINMLA